MSKEVTGELLVAAPTRWEEACFAVPAVRAFAKAGWMTGVLCPAEQEPFWRTVSGIEVISMHQRSRPAAVAREMSGRWRMAVVWEDGPAAQAIRKASLERVVGPANERWARWTSDKLDLAEPQGAHRVVRYLQTASRLGLDTRDPALFVPAGSPSGNAVLMIPDSDFGAAYEWEPGLWEELAGRVIAAGGNLTVGVLPRGRQLGSTIARRLGLTSLPLAVDATSLPVLTGFARVIAADGSIPHLAAHMGATCTTLFGPGDPGWKRPLGRHHAVARRHVECAPCLSPKCPFDRRCQTELTVDRVWAAITGACS